MSGSTPDLLVGEQRSGAAEAALDLVEDERDVALRRERAQLAQESVVEHAHAALALHRLDDQRRDRVRVERGVEVLEVALDDRDAAGASGRNGSAVARPVGRRERAEQPAVERAAQRDDLVLRLAHACAPSGART